MAGIDGYIAAHAAHDREREQLDRQHILLVNSDPAILDLARALLGEARYNVTATNAIPRLFALIAVAQPALLVIDLAIAEVAGWDLLIRLHAEASTTAIPIIVTARDPRLLAHAARHPYLFGGPVRLVIPFAVDALLNAVWTIIGPA